MENKEIHYKYAISYLLCTIIIIIALAYYDVPNLVDKFSFALTLSSLLLAILAIFYTIVSANKQDSQFSKILEATSNLGISVKDINDAATSISRLTKDIPEHFKSINSKIDSIQISYKELSVVEKLDSVPEPESDNLNSDKVNLKEILTGLHFNGMAVLYWFTIAAHHGKIMDYSDFADFEMADLQYAIGFLNAFSATGLVESKLHKESIIPIRCDQVLYKNLRKELDVILTIINKDRAKDLSDALNWVDEKYA